MWVRIADLVVQTSDNDLNNENWSLLAQFNFYDCEGVIIIFIMVVIPLNIFRSLEPHLMLSGADVSYKRIF